MRFVTPVLALLALALYSAPADAASCSTFVVVKAFDSAKEMVEVEHTRGNMKKYFPRPEGSPSDTTKIPNACRGKEKRTTSFKVKGVGGRLTLTQVRSNFEGKMLNKTDDPAWLPGALNKLIEDKTEVVIVVRPGMKQDDPTGVTTIYLPITDEELAEIKRLEAQAEDV